MLTFLLSAFSCPSLSSQFRTALVARKLWLHEMPMDHDTSKNQQGQEIPKKRVIRMLIIIVVAFAVCWLPVHVYQLDESLSTNGALWDPYVFVYICYWFSHANSAINRWLYIGLNGKMKAAFKNMVRCRHEETRQP